MPRSSRSKTSTSPRKGTRKSPRNPSPAEEENHEAESSHNQSEISISQEEIASKVIQSKQGEENETPYENSIENDCFMDHDGSKENFSQLEKQSALETTSHVTADPLAQGDAATKQLDELNKKKKSPELEKVWKPVKEDPTDFTGWTYLLQYVDQEDDIESAEDAYDAFLSHYPYCYGYWKKYADYERRKGHLEICDKVFERGLKAIPLSVDLWVHFLNYYMSRVAGQSSAEDHIRYQFERAIGVCGLEFRSSKLWEFYIRWELELQNFQNVMSLYDRLLSIPTQAYNTHFENFQQFVNNYSPKDFLSVEDFIALRKEVGHKPSDITSVEESTEEESEAPPGLETDSNGVIISEEELKSMRDRIIELRRKVHNANEIEVSKRWNFEDGIKRPYFHVKPLEKGQLKNWQDYLDWEIMQNQEQRILILFERCLIACALYEDFWMMYIRYLETRGPMYAGLLGDVLERACKIHLPKKPNIHLKWAAHEESKGNPLRASEILTQLEKNIPGLLQVMYRRINLERRKGKLLDAELLYQRYLDQLATNDENEYMAGNLAIKYSRFCAKVLRDRAKALAVLQEAMERDKDNPRLYMQLIDLGMQQDPPDFQLITTIFERALTSNLDIDQKLIFSQRRVEFLEDFATDINYVQHAMDEHHRLIKETRQSGLKRSAETDAWAEAKKSKASRIANGTAATGQWAQAGYAQMAQQYYPYSQGYGGYTAADYSSWNYNRNYSGYNYGTGQWGSYSYY